MKSMVDPLAIIVETTWIDNGHSLEEEFPKLISINP